MTQQDFSSPEHRLDNLSKLQIFQMYAELRRLIHHESHGNAPLKDLRVVCEVMEHNMAAFLDIPTTSLIGKLVDVASLDNKFRTGNGPAE